MLFAEVQPIPGLLDYIFHLLRPLRLCDPRIMLIGCRQKICACAYFNISLKFDEHPKGVKDVMKPEVGPQDF